MMKKTAICIALSALFIGTSAQAVTVYKNDNGDNIKVYGGAEVGGTFVSDSEKSPFARKKTFVDDSFLTLGLKGKKGDFYAKFELDAERQDWTEKTT